MGYELDKLMNQFGQAPVYNNGQALMPPNAGNTNYNNVMIPVPTPAYARGGDVRTHFYTGGQNDLSGLADQYDVPYERNPYMDQPPLEMMAANNIDTTSNPFYVPDNEDFIGKTAIAPRNKPEPYVPVNEPSSDLKNLIANSTVPAPVQIAIPGSKPTAQSLKNAPVEMLLDKYFPKESFYGDELARARDTSAAETKAFNKMLQDAIANQPENAPSKAELYFRLASAFGAPTKTGAFMENVGNAANVLAENAKEGRVARQAQKALQLQLGIEGQKIRMAGAKDDLATLRSLAGEEMKDKRTVAVEMMKKYLGSGDPISTAGKQAKDEGLVPGTLEFQKRVAAIADVNIEKQMSSVTAALANMSLQQANLALGQNKFNFQQAQAARLSPSEMKLKEETETNIGSAEQALKDLKEAYTLNPNTFDTSLVDQAQLKLLEASGSKDPKVIATRTQANLLSKQGIAKLKSAFGGNPTEGERTAILALDGLDAKSKEERAKIMKNTYSALKAKRDRDQKRLNEVNQGLYRDTTPSTGGIE